MRRGLASGRDDAKRLIEGNAVLVGGATGAKPATLVDPGTPITLRDEKRRWASRGGRKLEAALEAFGIDVQDKRVLDVGASTGGFTDVVLSRGAAAVTAVDVGYGQLLWRLSQDPRVTVLDRTNFRTIDVATIGPPFDVVVVDVSFISVTLLAENLRAAGARGTRYVVLVKPQFEAGRDRVGSGGIVDDPGVHAETIERVAAGLDAVGIGASAVIMSPITGAKGNVEYLLDATSGIDRKLGHDAISATVVR